MDISSVIEHPVAGKVLNTPPIAIAGIYIMGMSLSEWAAVTTIVYTLVLLYFRVKLELNKRNRRDRRADDRKDAED